MLRPPFYVVSDTHWFHDNIVKYCSRDTQIATLTGRPTDKYSHNEYMVDRWNSVVQPDDKILHLGDVFAWFKDGQAKFEERILPRLNGEKYLIIGNHDKAKPAEFERMGFTVVEPFTMEYQGRKVSFDHYPCPTAPVGRVHVHGHIHNNGYPRTSRWQDGSDPSSPKQINVSVEVIDYTPKRIDELLDNVA